MVAAALTVGCGADVEVPPSIAEQVAAGQAQRSSDDVVKETASDGSDETEGLEEPEEIEEPEEPEVAAVETTEIEAACTDLLATFGGDPLGPDDEGFVDVARTWRQLSVALHEAVTAVAEQDPTFAALAEATGEGSTTMRTLHIASEEGDVDAVVSALVEYDGIGARIEAEAEALELDGCLQDPAPLDS